MVGLDATLAMLMLSQSTTVMVQEPTRPLKVSHSARAACDKNTMYLIEYGFSSPKVSARLLVNGKAVSGAQVSRLLDHLSSQRAAYRITFECARKSTMVMRVYRAEPQQSGMVDYSVSRSTLVGDRLVEYRGPEAADAETFWFR